MNRTINAQATVATNGASSSEVHISPPRDRAVSTPPASGSAGAVEYRPKPGSVADRVLAFFRANPDEELSSPDIAAKFGVNQDGVRVLLRSAIAAEYLAVRQAPNSIGRGTPMLVYSAGPRLIVPVQPVVETIEWLPASFVPHHHGEVLIVTPHGVTTGYHCGCWRDADGIDADVTHWAAMPGGPA